MITAISKLFVPVAVNLYKLRNAKNANGDLFRAIHKQSPEYQGLWVIAPEGKVLATHHQIKNPKLWSQEILQTFEHGLQGYDHLTLRQAVRTNPHPQRGVGMLPAGGVNLAIYVRNIQHGKYIPGSYVLDSLTLSAKDLDGFAPPDMEVGSKWRVPVRIVKMLGRCLSPDSDQTTMPRPEEVAEAQLTGTLAAVDAKGAWLTYRGQLAMVHPHPHPDHKGKFSRGSARLEGVARYDLASKQLQALTLMLDITFYNYQPYHKSPYIVNAGVEWVREQP